jgi:hypothetical protein
MSWQTFYLICFVVGFVFALLGFAGVTLHWPFGHGHLFHLPAHGGAHAAGHAGGAPAAGGRGAAVSPFNFACLMAFLAWFGGMGYLLTARGQLSRLVIFLAALAAGTVGAAVIFVFLARVLVRQERFLDSADFEMVGVLGKVTVAIRSDGTGEIVYSQAGTRRSSGARSESGSAIERGREVIVTRYERGIAYVRPWEELADSTVEATGEREREDR